MSNVTIINIEMQLQGPQGPDGDATINDGITSTTPYTWSSQQIANYVKSKAKKLAIIFG